MLAALHNLATEVNQFLVHFLQTKWFKLKLNTFISVLKVES